LITALFVAVLAGASFAGGFTTLMNEVTFPLPNGWLVAGDSTRYPIQLVSENLDAEILIFKSIINSDETINDPHQLRGSVANVVEDVIPSLPSSRLLRNTGMLDGNRAMFVLEFDSDDIDEARQIRHSLKGILYRHPKGHQVMFTVWGKTPVESYQANHGAIQLVQDGLFYIGPQTDTVFTAESSTIWYYFFAMMAVVGLLFMFRSFKARNDRVRFRVSEHHWRCDCGRLNHNEQFACRRCGREKPTPVRA
jgi:hypothetical protein